MMKLRNRNRHVNRTRIFTLAAYVLALIGTLLMVAPAQAAPLRIFDNFSEPIPQQTVVATWAGSQTSANGYADDAGSGNILGTQRDVLINLYYADFLTQRAEFFAGGGVGLASFSTADGMRADLTIVWDGDDLGATSIDYTGLSPLNLKAPIGGATPEGFAMIGRADSAYDVILTVYTDSTHASEATITIADTNDRFYPFWVSFDDDFTQVSGAAGPADFTDVGAVVLYTDTEFVPSIDLTLDIFDVTDRDFGDLPDTYGTLATSSGAYHLRGDIYLGSAFDGETTGAPGVGADGDNVANSNDEDGVIPTGNPWSVGVGGGELNVTVGAGAGCLYGWFDWNDDGDFGGGADVIEAYDEKGINGLYVTGTNQLVTIDVPANGSDNVASGSLYARFRLVPDTNSDNCATVNELDTTDAQSLVPPFPWYTIGEGDKGAARDGEVEDYIFYFGPAAITMESVSQAATQTNVLPLAAVMAVLMLATYGLLRRRHTMTLDAP